MKVAVITRHAVTNYGSLLQVVATQQVIEDMGHTCEIIDYIREDEHYSQLDKTMLAQKPSWNNNPIKRTLYLALRKPESVKAGRKFEEERKKYLHLTKRYINSEQLLSDKPAADVYMTGSDQVWGPIGSDLYDDSFFLTFTEDNDKRVSYAASFGRTEMSVETKKHFSDCLGRYNHISVRENSAVEILSQMGMRVSQVLDPTLLLDSSYWSCMATPIRTKQKYVLVYQIHNDKCVGAYADKVAKAKGLPLIRISPAFHQAIREGKFVWCPKVGEFLSYIKNAECLITDSFHGTAFAINFNTPFVEVLPNNKTGTRNISILTLTGLTDRILTDDNDLNLAERRIDFSYANTMIEEERRKSLYLLKMMIERWCACGEVCMGTVCQKNTCTGCMACVNICQKGAIRIEDTLSAYNACIDADECVNCGRCREVCQNNYPIEVIKPISWKQGWADDPQVRESGSSGGAASAIAKKFIENGGVVCSCKFDNGEFVFDFADSTEMLRQFAGSKYVKSNPKGIYIKITELLKTKRVLFIGLPCQVAAVKKSIKSTLADNLYTIDLICHGTPSPKVLEVFLNQHGYKLKDIENIRFRRKGKFQITDGYKGVIATGVTDSYSISFLNGINYTDNCYQCKYAKIERVSDITLGDSWGTENESEMKKGVSLILCQSAKGESLIKDAELHLEAVDIKKAMENNHQLHEPSKKPEGRDAFMNGIEANKNYTRLVFKQYPKQSIRQLVKLILIKMKVMRGGAELRH